MTQFSININKDDSILNDYLYCWSIFNTRPNKIVIYNTYTTKEFDKIVSEISSERNIFTEVIPDGDDQIVNDRLFLKIDDGLYLSYVQIDRSSDNSIINEVCFLYKGETDFDRIQSIVDSLESCLIDFAEEQGNKINTISIGSSGLEIDPITMDVDLDNIELFYNHKTMKNVKKLIKSIKSNDKGLSVLFGPRGTGKTSIINYISSSVDRMIIFIPNNMIDSTINNPDFKRFIRRYQNPLLVIDDCEMMFNETYNKSNILVNNLLQIVDGFLSDSIGAQVIALFNVQSDDEIDHSLLDCNSLIDVVEFNKLNEEESTELSKYLGHSKKYKSSMRMIDVIKMRKEKGVVEIGI